MATILPAPPPTRAASRAAMLRTRLRPGSWRRPLGALAIAWVLPGLTVAVLFGVFFTAHDGPEARAYRQAPACVGDSNLATCVGDFTAVINGVRAPANGRSSADVSYVTSDGAINQWGTFDGNSAVIARTAATEQHAVTPLGIRVWRGSIVGAEVGGSWHWAEGNPPGNTIPAIFLAVSFALLLLVVRVRIHRKARLVANRRRLLVDDLCQVVAAAGSVVLLADGFWPGAILALAVLLSLELSSRQCVRRGRLRLGAGTHPDAH